MKALALAVAAALATFTAPSASLAENIDIDELIEQALQEPGTTICCKIYSRKPVRDENGEIVKDEEGEIKYEWYNYPALVTGKSPEHAGSLCAGGDHSRGSYGHGVADSECAGLR